MRVPDVATTAIIASAALLGLVLLVPAERTARASPGVNTVLSEANLPAVGPAYVDSFSLSCAQSAATRILPKNTISYTCQNPSTVRVAVGDSTISDPAGGLVDAPIYCATNCPSSQWGGNALQEFCRGDTPTTVYCRALVSRASAP